MPNSTEHEPCYLCQHPMDWRCDVCKRGLCNEHVWAIDYPKPRPTETKCIECLTKEENAEDHKKDLQ